MVRDYRWSTPRGTYSFPAEISSADFAAAHALIDAPAEIKLREAVRYCCARGWPEHFRNLSAGTGESLPEIVVGFAQSFSYHHEGLQPRLPAETLQSRWANCADRSILAASLLQSLGFSGAAYVEVAWPYHALLGLDSPEAQGDAIFIHGRRFVLWELTSPGARLGTNFFANIIAARVVFPAEEED